CHFSSFSLRSFFFIGTATTEIYTLPYTTLFRSQSRFLFDVHPNAAVRETADKWYQEAERFATDLALNRPLYDAFVDLDVSQEDRSEEHTSELQSRFDLVCRLLLEKKKTQTRRRR